MVDKMSMMKMKIMSVPDSSNIFHSESAFHKFCHKISFSVVRIVFADDMLQESFSSESEYTPLSPESLSADMNSSIHFTSEEIHIIEKTKQY